MQAWQGQNQSSPYTLSPPFPSPIPHHPQKATCSSMLIKSTSLSTQSDRLVPELDTIVPLESTKAYNMVDIVHAVSPTSVCLSAGLAVCMSWCFGSVRKCRTHTPSEQAPQAGHGVVQSQGTEEHVVGRVSGCGHPTGSDGNITACNLAIHCIFGILCTALAEAISCIWI